MDVWHHPSSVVGDPIRLAIFMWLEQSRTEEELVQRAAPLDIALAT